MRILIRKHQLRRLKDLCIRCGSSLDNLERSMRLCNECCDEHKERVKRHQNERVADGLCVQCGGKLDKYAYHCNSCMQKKLRSSRINFKRKVSTGNCGRCGRKRGKGNSKSRCKRCALILYRQATRRFIKIKIEGRCVRCGNVRNGLRAVCDLCAEKANIHYHSHKGDPK